MKIAVIGRTRWLLDAARELVRRGHSISIVWTGEADKSHGSSIEDFALFARENGSEFATDLRINSSENVQRLKSLNCDIAVSVNWLTILGQSVLDCFRLGVLNAHAGDLPRYRGNACPNWAILANEPHVGLCIHLMVPELDAGPIVLRDRFSLNNDTYIGEVIEWLQRRVPRMLVEAAEGLDRNHLHPEAQSEHSVAILRTFPRRPSDSRIDWRWSADRILAMVRASSRPYSGAFTSLEGKRRLTIWCAQLHDPAMQYLAVPGQVCMRVDGDPIIACGDGMLRLTDFDLDGEIESALAKYAVTRSLRHRLI